MKDEYPLNRKQNQGVITTNKLSREILSYKVIGVL